MKRFILFSLAFFLIVPIVSAQEAVLNFQGVLREASGRAVDDGSYTITFNLYNVESGGSSLWSETHDNVQVKNGVCSVDLGSINAFDIGFNENYWLGVTVSGDSEMSPRARLTSTPYALALTGVDNKFPSSGNVEIGQDDASSGTLLIHGDSAGDEGGEIEIFTTATNDENIDHFVIDAYTQDFRMFARNNGGSANTFFQYSGENQTIRLNGKIGINSATPSSQLFISSTDYGWNQTENFNHPFTIRGGNDAYLSMGADDAANCSYIQSADNGVTSPITLNARGGRVAIGKETAEIGRLHIRDTDHQLFLENPSGTPEAWAFQTNSDGQLHLNYFIYNSGSWHNLSGYAFIPGDTNYNWYASSDQRLKKNIETLPSVLDKVRQLNPVKYHLLDSRDTAPKSIGFIAQEVQPLFPEIVGETDGTLSLAYSQFGVVAIAAIKELSQQVDEQKAENEALRKELETIRTALIKANLLPVNNEQ